MNKSDFPKHVMRAIHSVYDDITIGGWYSNKIFSNRSLRQDRSVYSTAWTIRKGNYV